jgi:uncharacterized protein YcbK (DUF882 family)
MSRFPPRASALALALAVAAVLHVADRSILSAETVPARSHARVATTALGHSAALRVTVVEPGEAFHLPLEWIGPRVDGLTYRWLPVQGTTAALPEVLPFGHLLTAPGAPGVWNLELLGEEWSQRVAELTVITAVSASGAQGGRLNGYHIGSYPRTASAAYAPPRAFIEVTRENQDLQLSTHLRLRQFLTRDQANVWPKYVALDLRLVDKLELMLQELERMGVTARGLHVMSGFRTPQYNGRGGGGRSSVSRHMYGDAADVWVDNEGDGYVSDLNGDGRRDVQDVILMRAAVTEVERRHPHLVGGVGVYTNSGARSPFIHIDVRGTHARW